MSYNVSRWFNYAFSMVTKLVTIENAYAATAHAPNHVIREQRVKNDYIFGIPDPDLPIHYTTFIELRQQLRVVYSRAV